MHWTLKVIVAGLAGGATAVTGIMAPMLATRQVLPSYWPDLTVLFLLSALVTGGAYYLKGPQQP